MRKKFLKNSYTACMDFATMTAGRQVNDAPIFGNHVEPMANEMINGAGANLAAS